MTSQLLCNQNLRRNFDMEKFQTPTFTTDKISNPVNVTRNIFRPQLSLTEKNTLHFS